MATNQKAATGAVDLASDEQRALKAWEKGGMKGPRPETPNLDVVLASVPGAKSTSTRRRTSGIARVPANVRYTHDGEPVKDSMNKLSTIAYFFTRRIGGDDVKRLGAAEFRKVLADLGVADPEHTTWSVELPNGIVIGATVAGDKPAAAPKTAPAKRATAATKKGTTPRRPNGRIAPKPKKTAVKKTAAKKPSTPAGKRQVTPRPKTTK